MTMILFLSLLLAVPTTSWAQPVLSPDCAVSFTQAWIESDTAMRVPRLSHYEVQFAPARKGPYTVVTSVIVPLFPQPERGDMPPRLYSVQCPGYIPSGTYWIRLRPVSAGGQHTGRRTHPVQAILDRGVTP
jgi:hypothetical protein